MDREFDKVVEEALSLDPEQRGELVDRLIVSIAKEPTHFRSQLHEAKRRFDAYERGEIAAVEANDAMARVRKLRER